MLLVASLLHQSALFLLLYKKSDLLDYGYRIVISSAIRIKGRRISSYILAIEYRIMAQSIALSDIEPSKKTIGCPEVGVP
jgi:hypothetical protein